MALLEIFDPKAPPTPVGIDLGTTHSLVAYVKDGRPRVVSDCDGRRLLPSVVHYDGKGGVVVGATAQRRAAESPRSTLASVKRLMGRGADDAETQRPSPYTFVPRGDGDPNVVRLDVGASAGEKIVTPVEASAEILRALKRLAEDDLRTVGGAVITVPAYFDDAQRQATKDAGRLAGLEVLRLLNEPTAAALAYGLDQKQNGLFAVYDLGGGTFDVTVLRLEDGVFQVLSTGGDSALGGDDMDRTLAETLVAARGRSLAALSPTELRVVLDAARAAKHGLTDAPEVELEHPLGGATIVLDRAAFDAAIAPLLERTGKAARRALRDASVVAGDLDGVILVGGSTRVPAVRAYVERLFGKPPLADIDPDEVVALGAAVQASLLAGQGGTDDVLLLDVTPLSLGIEVGGGVVDKILPRNTTVPTAARATYTTQEDRQTGFELHVVQGERELAADCRSLARFTLKGIPPMPAGLARLEVTFRVDADGLLEVHARETTTGLEQRVDVKPSYGLDDDAVEEMLLAAIDHGEADLLARQLAEARVEARRVVVATRSALAADPELLDPSERAVIDEAMARLEAAVEKTDARAVRLRLEDLEHATKPFAERRMNRAIAKALEGQALGEVEREVAKARGLENAHAAPDLGTK